MNKPKEQALAIVSALVGPEDGAKIIDALDHAGFMFLRSLSPAPKRTYESPQSIPPQGGDGL